MSPLSLYTSYGGRIGRRTWWIYTLVLGVAVVIVAVVLALTIANNDPATTFIEPDAAIAYALRHVWVNVIVFVLFLVPWTALAVKRRHDRSANGLLVWIAAGLTAIFLGMQVTGLFYTTTSLGDGFVAVPTLAGSIVSGAVVVADFVLLVVLGFLRGDPGPNMHGADPLG
ncbi:DUF805 domain-containing protein [Cucumibacter marinus]|uniref:DUF805 domain-containing protein n=1 Tax=Cucumibacter marinus TaxID=1121252 RepID=UPI0004074CAE|nr:DUF805 domain-containing protein [Cucumibacter marinus]